MKRWLYLAALAAAVLVLGDRSAGVDIGKLQPVQVVAMSYRDGQICLRTDTGDMGLGRDLDSALADMKERAAAQIFLDTAEHVIVAPACEDLIGGLAGILRPSCAICMGQGVDLPQAAAYLQVHKPQTTLMEYRAGDRTLPTLIQMEEGMVLVSG